MSKTKSTKKKQTNQSQEIKAKDIDEADDEVIAELNPKIMVDFLKKLDKIAISMQKKFQDTPISLEILLACLSFSAHVAQELGMTENGFISLALQHFQDSINTSNVKNSELN